MKLLVWLGWCLLWWLTPSAGNEAGKDAHQFHVSKCLVEYSARERSLQISLHLFLDDLEEALRRRGADKLFLCTSREAPESEAHLEKYLREHFHLRINDRPATFQFLGKEASEDMIGVWCYLEIPGVDDLRKLHISNDLLMEVFDDQKNMVNIVGPDKRNGLFLFQKGASSDAVEF